MDWPGCSKTNANWSVHGLEKKKKEIKKITKMNKLNYLKFSKKCEEEFSFPSPSSELWRRARTREVNSSRI